MKDLSTGFLLSNWYSGATLLSLLVDQHPQIVTNGEGFYHKHSHRDLKCSCGTTVRACPFYRRAAAAMWDQDDFDKKIFAVTPRFSKYKKINQILGSTISPGKWRRSAIYAFPSTRKEYVNYVNHHVEFMRNAVAITDSSIYFDGTKSIRRAEIFLSENEYKSSPIILLVRDPGSWCAAWLHKKSQQSSSFDIHDAVRTWIEYIRRSFLLKQRFPSAPFMVVRYEDLCSQPETRLKEIENFMGLTNVISNIVNRETFRTEDHHVLGNKMRFSFDGKVKAARDRSDELSGSEKTLVLDACAHWMKKLGY